jgi:hypothetical protein
LKIHPGGGELVCVTVAPFDGIAHPGHLSPANHERLARRCRERLDAAGVEWFVGAFDWSRNEHRDALYQPHWLEHFHGFTATTDRKALKQSLLKQFPATLAILRPVKVRPWDGKIEAIRYMVKPDFHRRIGVDTALRGHGSTERVCRDTDKQPLRASEKRELAPFLTRVGFQGRLLLKQVQFTKLKGSGPTFVHRPPRPRQPVAGQKPSLRPQNPPAAP